MANIARQTGLREHVVRYAIATLRQRNAMLYVPYIDVGRFGLSDCCVYFNHLASKKGSRERLIRSIASSAAVGYFAELAGEFQYTVAVYCRRIHDVEQFFANVARASDGAILDRTIATRVTWSFFRSKYWAERRSRVEVLSCSAAGTICELDEVDHQVLSVLAKSEFFHLRDIARAAKLPSSTVEYRIRRMEQRGIILGHAYKLAPPYFGLHKYRVLITLARPSGSLAASLFEFAKKHPNITSFVRCVGNWDIELSIELEQPTVLPDVIEELSILSGEGLLRLKVLNVLTHHKVCLYPFQKLSDII